MSNLEKDILDLFDSDHEGADRTSSGGRHRRQDDRSNNRRGIRVGQRRGDTYSASENDDEGEDMDTGDDEMVDVEDTRMADDFSDSDSAPLDQWGEDLMGDHKDRKWLASLTEVERERILAERQEKRDQLMEQREVRMKLKAGARVSAANAMAEGRDSRSRRRGAVGGSGVESSSGSAFSDLKRAHERRRHRHRTRQHRGDHWSGSSSEDSDVDETESTLKAVASLDELNRVCLSRNQLEQWLFQPFFAKTVIGCVVRIVTRNRDSSGKEYNQYKMMEIVEVIQGEGKDQPPYHLNKTLTDKYLTLRYGAVEKDYSMETISNSSTKPEEYEHWLSELRIDRVRCAITHDMVQSKLLDMEKARNYHLSEAEVGQMVAERNRLRRIETGGFSGNLVMERTRLNQYRMEARQNSDWEQLKKIEAQLAELERISTASAAKNDSGKASSASTHKQLLAPSTSRYGSGTASGTEGGLSVSAARRNRLLSPGSNKSRVHTPTARGSSPMLASRPIGADGGHFAPVPELKQQELVLKSKVTPGYVQRMAENGGYDMSFLAL